MDRITTLLLLTVCVGCGGTSSGRPVRETRTLTVPSRPGTALRIVTAGDVDVVTAKTGDVEIECRLRSPDPARLKAAEVVAERGADDALEIRVDWPGGRGPQEFGVLKVALPDSNGVVVETASGHVKLHGLVGKSKVTTSTGSTSILDHTGDVHVVSNGKVDVTNADNVTIESSGNASLQAVDVRGTVSIRAEQASVLVELADSSTGPVSVNARHGTVTVKYGAAFTGRVRLSSQVAVQYDTGDDAEIVRETDDEVELRFGTVEVESSIRCELGAVSLRRARRK